MPELSSQTVPGTNIPMLRINAGELAALSDASCGQYNLNMFIDTLHFYSGDETIDVKVDSTTGAINIQVDPSKLPAPVSAITAMRGAFNDDTNVLSLEIDYTDDAGDTFTIQLDTGVDFSDLQGPWNNQAGGDPAVQGDNDIFFDAGAVRLGAYGTGTYDDANPTRLAAFDADGNLVEFKDFCTVWVGTRAQLQALRNSSGLIPGCVYEITDFSRGNLADSRIFVQAAARDKLYYDVALLTTHDTQPWHAIYEVDTHRVLMVRDNLRNVVESDEGNEVDNFPWGVATVYDNHMKNVAFTYTGGTFGDNTASDNCSINMAGGDVRNNHFQNNVDFRVNGTHQVYNSTFNRCRYYGNDGSAGLTNYCDFSNDAYIEPGAITMERSDFGYCDVRARGSVGRIDNSDIRRSQVYVRNIPNLDIDDLTTRNNGRVLMDNSARCRILRSTISDNGYVQRAGGTPSLIMQYTHIKSQGYVRLWSTGVLTLNYSDINSTGRVDHNTPNNNRVDRGTIKEISFCRFLETAANCLLDYSTIANNGYVDFRSTVVTGRVHRSTVEAGYILINASNNCRVLYSTVSSLDSYIRMITGCANLDFRSCSFTAWGRILCQTARSGNVQGVSAEGTAYIQLTGGTGALQHSSFDSYYYHYCTNQAATHQALQGSGRQTYTAPTTAITGAGQRNY